MKDHFTVAIDGPSGAGKSTISRAVAERLHILYVDTGAIYRTVGLAVLRAGRDPASETEAAELLPEVRISLQYTEKGQRVLLGGEDVSERIRTPEASRSASLVSAHPSVRAFLLEMQRALARGQSCVMDGRDIGTVVLPDADVKIYLTASAEDRAERRMKELCARGTPQDFETVLSEIRERDARDMNRAVAPLRRAEDAVLCDTTGNTLEQSIEAVTKILSERLA